MRRVSKFTADITLSVLRGLAKVDFIPKDKCIVLLYSNARVGTYLCLQNPGGRTGPLGERCSTFLEQVERI
jgi:hypothetical protein